ncbi:hypothetical protein HMPREF9554_01547 [Treponema phagedenis F0421]|nr:hypothetical protein HMPREF9554_01547 [Treponema phagedenis F0421]
MQNYRYYFNADSKITPLRNFKRCFKASTGNCKIGALKLVGEVKRKWQNFALVPCRTLFYKIFYDLYKVLQPY